jgi:hypothetical protein
MNWCMLAVTDRANNESLLCMLAAVLLQSRI